MSDNLINRALERLRRATELDGSGDVAHAVDEYDAGVVLLARAMAIEKDPGMRDTLSQKCSEYADRADALRASLPPAPAPAQQQPEKPASSTAPAADKKPAAGDSKPSAAPQPTLTDAEREQADLEARLNALKGSHITTNNTQAPYYPPGYPPYYGGYPPEGYMPDYTQSAPGSFIGGYDPYNGMSVDEIMHMSENPRTVDEQADDIVRQALAEIRQEEADRQLHQPPPQQQQPPSQQQPAKQQPKHQPPTHPPPQKPPETTVNPEDDGWEELERRAEEEYGGYDDEDIRAMIAESREELERAMRMEDPDFNWDDYDLPEDLRKEGEALKRERERTKREQERYLDGEKEKSRRERFADNAQRNIDAFKSYIAKYKKN